MDSSGQSGYTSFGATIQTVYSFNTPTNGATPLAPLTLGSHGMYYGTTKMGGSNYTGTLFDIDTNGTLNTLIHFAGTNGANPSTALTLGNDWSPLWNSTLWRHHEFTVC